MRLAPSLFACLIPFWCISCQMPATAPVPAAPPLAQPADPKLFYSFRADHDPALSADPESDFWRGIPGVVVDKSVLGPEMPAFHAEIRSRWTKTHVYFLYICHYQKLTVSEHPDTEKETPRLWLRDVVELYLGSPLEPPTRYRELQMSPAGEFLDNDIDATVNRPGYNGEDKWNSGFKVKARVDEAQKIWFGEMQVPFAAIDARTPSAGEEFPINIYRQDGTGRERDFLAWQPPGVWNPHHPEKFGKLRLVPGR